MLNYLFLMFIVRVIAENKNPNFVVILTDDQDLTLGSMTPMENVQRLLAKEGVTFTKSYVTSPICCPSRASILSGQYMHNHHTRTNSLDSGCYGTNWTEREDNTLAPVLKEHGYNTFYAGKYLNQYGIAQAGGPERVPPGWSDWHGLVGNSVYYKYTLSHNGKPKTYDKEYLTDVIRDLAISFIEKQKQNKPFLMMLAPPSPHAPFTPAPRHRGKFSNVTVPKHPNYNVTGEDKHWLIRMPPSPLPAALSRELDRVYHSRLETLLAVDEMVADVVNTLEKEGLLGDTYIVYTSDNGYHIGQFSQVYDKRQPYESDVKVPLIIKGPGLGRGVENNKPVLNIDLAPTIIQLAGINIPEYMDGSSIFSDTDSNNERYMLIEYNGEGGTGSVSSECPWKYDGDNLSQCLPKYDCKCQDARNNTYSCIRHVSNYMDFKYCFFYEAVNTTFHEVYNLLEDGFELHNAKDQILPETRWWYQSVLLPQMKKCKGTRECNRKDWS